MSGSEPSPPPGSAGQEPPPPSPPPSSYPSSYPPPPGWQPPAAPAAPAPQQWPSPQPALSGQPGQQWQQPPPDMLAATHRPGAIPLRPLQLGDIYDAAFRIIRYNPRATVGSAVLVTAVAMLVPVLVTALLTLTVDLSLDPEADLTTADAAGLIGALGSWLLGIVLQSIGLILVTGMVAHVTMAAAIGKKLSLGEAWAATKGKRAKLIGLVLLLAVMLILLIALFVLLWIAGGTTLDATLVVLFLFLTIPCFVAVLWWFWIRIYYLPVPALMLEDVGIFGAIERGHALTHRAFWRVFGIATLTALVTAIAGVMLTTPISLVMDAVTGGGSSGQYDALWFSVVNALSSVVQAAFVAPFTAAVTSLQYVDQRIRKEAFDVELMTRSGIAA